MSLAAEDKVFVLQRFVNSYAQDLLVLHAALVEPSPPEAQKLLIGGLNYALDQMDMFPDHRGPLGIADDAIILRITAKLARAAGAKHAGLEPLALDANNVVNLFPDLAGPLEKLVATLPRREVRSRNADKILTHNMSRAAFDADVAKEAKKFVPAKIATKENAPRAIEELYKAMRDALSKAKLMRG
jgi:uncharacterized membrane protein YkvA (DUF1232 family)